MRRKGRGQCSYLGVEIRLDSDWAAKTYVLKWFGRKGRGRRRLMSGCEKFGLGIDRRFTGKVILQRLEKGRQTTSL